MKLGIDFGTNRIVVAAADRGNYPLITFDTPDGSHADWFPALIAVNRKDARDFRYGWDAWESQTDEDWVVVRSIKRLLDKAGPRTSLDLGPQVEGRTFSIPDLLAGLTTALAWALRRRSNLQLESGEPLEAIIGVPANANTNQRFLTVDAFRQAGFEVLGILNEPSAASIEFGHRQRQGQNKAARETVLVYDLGGGTFDASLVTIDENVHHVVASDGIATLGGDDFDQMLADLALEKHGVSHDEAASLPTAAWFRLLEECRLKKEALNPNSRRIAVDLEVANSAWGTVGVLVAEFCDRARPLVEETMAVAEELLAKIDSSQFEALYITGGGSELPLVARVLRERFGRRVRRSAYTRSATAIGLAIQAGQPGVYRLSEQLSRYFGVWREADNGAQVVFDPLFEKGQALPGAGEPPLVRKRNYAPAHNVGHFRFLECSHRAADGSPSGDVTFWDEIRFAFEPHLQRVADLSAVPVHLSERSTAEWAEEAYQCDAGGSIAATFSNLSSGYAQHFQLGRWSEAEEQLQPIRKARAAKA